MQGKTLAFISTHIINKAVISEFKKLSDANMYDCILVIDNTRLKIQSETPVVVKEFFGINIKCFLFDEKIHNNLNLPYCNKFQKNGSFSDVLWHNADYRFYYVKKYFPEYEYFWQFDYDVFFNGKSYAPFFEKYKDNKNDLLITNYGPTSKASGWFWAKDIEWIYKNINLYCSFFPVCRLSSNAIDFLYKKRLDHGKKFIKLSPFKKNKWLNCELFVPTELTNNGFLCESIIEPNVKLEEIDLSEDRIFENPDNMLYHAVKGQFLKRLKENKCICKKLLCFKN